MKLRNIKYNSKNNLEYIKESNLFIKGEKYSFLANNNLQIQNDNNFYHHIN